VKYWGRDGLEGKKQCGPLKNGRKKRKANSKLSNEDHAKGGDRLEEKNKTAYSGEISNDACRKEKSGWIRVRK